MRRHDEKTLALEKELLAKVAQGDQRAFKTIYDMYRPQIYTFSLKHLHSTDQAEEAVQEVFLKIWKLAQRLTEIEDLENYLLTLSRNKSIDMLRRMKLESKNIQPLEEDWDQATNVTEEQIMLNDTRKVLDQGISLLPPQQKQVYQLCQVQGLSQKLVAEQMNLSPETVKRHMKLALKFLREHISSHTDVAALLIILKLL